MALRVLLADESTTIKKVMQLALQDFAVEVKAVHVGVDVIEVAKTYKPDLIFVDVLLQKRNGYEVSSDIKKDPALKSTPVVLMWSSFMDLDDLQADRSGADRRLEKPFDVENLRQLVLELVPKTRDQRLAHFLKFPDSMTEPLKEEEAKKQTPPPLPPRSQPSQPQAAPTPRASESPKAATKAGFVINLEDTAAQAKALDPKPEPVKPVAKAEPPPRIPDSKPPVSPKKPTAKQEEDEDSPNWNMGSFEDLSDFASKEDDSKHEEDEESYKELRLTNRPASSAKAKQPEAEEAHGDDSEPWSHQDLSRFKIDLPPVSIEDEEIDLDINHDLASPTKVQPSRPERTTQRNAETVFANQNLTQGYGSHDENQEIEHSTFEANQDEFENANLEIDELTSEPLEQYQPLEFEKTSGNDLYTQTLSRGGRDQIPEGIPETLEPMNYPSAESTSFYQSNASAPVTPQLTAEQLEEIVRAQTREIIETVVRRVVPDIATDIIRAELRRLLDENPR